jgi:hypothetical protein
MRPSARAIAHAVDTKELKDASYHSEWLHARRNGCGGFPRTSNSDRVTCPSCITDGTPEATTRTFEDEPDL